MSKILCVTNRKLCQEPFLERLEKIAAEHPAGIILREKDLSENEYHKLAERVMALCKVYEVPCILHYFYQTAIALQAQAIHVPLDVLRRMTAEEKLCFSQIGVSCHSIEQIQEAEHLGCTYVTAGHIFETDCKKGLPGRGLEFLQMAVQNASVPVYAIGGISHRNIASVQKTGAEGVCLMSSLMVCQDVHELMIRLEETQ